MSNLVRPVYRTRAVMRYLLIVAIALGLVAIFLLATVSANNNLFNDYYTALLNANIGITSLLGVMVLFQVFSLKQRLKNKIFGSKLTLRFVVLFGLMAILPGALIYGVSVKFVSRSIDSWFEVHLDSALETGLNLGRSVIEAQLKELSNKGNSIALKISVIPVTEQYQALEMYREQAGIQEAAIYSLNGQILNKSISQQPAIAIGPLSPSIISQLEKNKHYSVIESIPDAGLYLRIVSPISGSILNTENKALQLLQPVPPQLAKDAEQLQLGYNQYQELQLSRNGIKRLYALTLTLTLLLALLSALGIAFLLSHKLSAPLSALAEGTRAVAQGDFSRRVAVDTLDELGQLTQSFNSMTLQLAEAQIRVDRNRAQVAQAKAYLESVLGHLSAGVLTFDRDLGLRSANPSAGQILGTSSALLLGSVINQWSDVDKSLSTLGQTISEGFATHSAEWQQQVEREYKGSIQVLLVRGTRFDSADDIGLVVVFDDVTQLMQAQRDAAWSEVARRLAHEIKNPLTPIQLSAERMQLKLSSKLSDIDAAMLTRSTTTIVNQVAALKRMVDAFGQYAKTPEPVLRQLDLNELVNEVLALYESWGSVIERNLTSNATWILGDAMQLRQVIHNLLRNAKDAVSTVTNPKINIKTIIKNSSVEFSVTDTGIGFPENLLHRVFEPYVTTKPKGTGLGLSIVRKIIEEHHGSVNVSNVIPNGACVSIAFPFAPSEVSQGSQVINKA